MTMTRDEIRRLIYLLAELPVTGRVASAATMLEASTALQQLLDRVEKLEARLEIDHAYRAGDGPLGLERFELPEDQRETFPDKILCLEVEIAHLKGELRSPVCRRRRVVLRDEQLELEDYITKKKAEDESPA